MKSFYFGGQKSGKTSCAIKKVLKIATSKPYYIATYDNSYDDKAMQQRVQNHIKERGDDFFTIEETKDLTKVIKSNETYLIDCMTMFILNNMNNGFDYIKRQLEEIFKIDCNIVFILNDINNGVIPMDKYSREFVDLSSLVGQILAKNCDEVIEVKYSLERRLK